MTLKYMFLDIDEVLNGSATEYFMPGLHSNMEPLCTLHIGNKWICPHRVSQLNRILEAHPDTRVILSSAWRGYGIRAVQAALKREGFKGTLVGSTPPESYPKISRDMEISQWFECQGIDHEEVRFVILDDLPMDTIVAFQPHHVQTTGAPTIIHDDGRVEVVGFSDADVEHAIMILNGEVM